MNIYFIDETDSTNRLLKTIITEKLQNNEKIEQFYSVCADFQSAGRGSGQNKWFSSKEKNILISTCFFPYLKASEQFYFNIYFSVITHHFLSQLIDNVKIKWPNDIYAGDKKIAGILIEHNIKSDFLNYTIAGIGINVNESIFPDNIPNPTSILLESNKLHNPKELADLYLSELKNQYFLLENKNFEELKKYYLKNLYRINECHLFSANGLLFKGIIKDIDDYGRILIENINDSTCSYYEFKQIAYIID